MILKGKTDEITLTDIKNLIENEVPEGRTIEYKADLNIKNDEERREFLADISSFANADGGDIIFGITENRESGFPENIVGISISNLDEDLRRVNSIIETGLQPRIFPIQNKHIKLENGKYLLIYRIKKSWNGPHRIIFKSWDKFFSRNSKGKYPLDVSELRNAFNLSESRFDKIRSFIQRRSHEIYYGDYPVQMEVGPKVICHVIPANAFDPQNTIDLSQNIRFIENISTLTGYQSRGNFNFDGIMKTSCNPVKKTVFEYVQIYRNGVIESVGGEFLLGIQESCIPLKHFEDKVIEACKNYIKNMKEMNIENPIFIFITIVGAQNFTMCVNKGRFFGEPQKIRKEILQLPDLIVNDFDLIIEDELKKTFDGLANACGLERSEYYDNEGKRKK